MRARDYSDDALEVQSERDRTPRATALLHRVYEAQGELLDVEKRRDLEGLEFALGLHTRCYEDLTEEGEASFVKRLEKIVGKEAL